MRHTEQVFESFEAFIDAASAPASPDHSGRVGGRGEWYGTETFEEAVRLARQGWPEGAARVAELRAKVDGVVADLVAAKSSSYAYDVTGQWVDVGLHLSGEPECFGVEVQDSSVTSQPVVKLVFNAAASASVSSGSLVSRGAAAAAAVDILEATGRRVEVWVVKGGQAKRTNHTNAVRVRVKSPEQPLDLDRLTFALAHTACLRRLLFSVQHFAGFPSNKTYPHEVPADGESILVPHVFSAKGLSREGLLEQIASLCRQAGVDVDFSAVS